MVYTDEQIHLVCNKAVSTMKEFTTIKGCALPIGTMVQAMEAGETPDEIGNVIFETISNIPFRQAGFTEAASKLSMQNIATYVQSKLTEYITNITVLVN